MTNAMHLDDSIKEVRTSLLDFQKEENKSTTDTRRSLRNALLAVLGFGIVGASIFGGSVWLKEVIGHDFAMLLVILGSILLAGAAIWVFVSLYLLLKLLVPAHTVNCACGAQYRLFKKVTSYCCTRCLLPFYVLEMKISTGAVEQRTCSNCGVVFGSVGDGIVTCGNCGARQQIALGVVTPELSITCPTCKTLRPSGSTFCGACGELIDKGLVFQKSSDMLFCDQQGLVNHTEALVSNLRTSFANNSNWMQKIACIDKVYRMLNLIVKGKALTCRTETQVFSFFCKVSELYSNILIETHDDWLINNDKADWYNDNQGKIVHSILIGTFIADSWNKLLTQRVPVAGGPDWRTLTWKAPLVPQGAITEIKNSTTQAIDHWELNDGSNLLTEGKRISKIVNELVAPCNSVEFSSIS